MDVSPGQVSLHAHTLPTKAKSGPWRHINKQHQQDPMGKNVTSGPDWQVVFCHIFRRGIAMENQGPSFLQPRFERVSLFSLFPVFGETVVNPILFNSSRYLASALRYPWSGERMSSTPRWGVSHWLVCGLNVILPCWAQLLDPPSFWVQVLNYAFP